MALITCPDCSTEVSSRALTCPKCGAPVFERSARGTVTTQRTGKGIKGQMLLFKLTLVISIFWFFIAKGAEADTTWPILFFCLSLLMLYITRIRGWWHHA